MSFTPFDITCFTKLQEKFQYLFEDELINEICKSSSSKTINAEEVIMDIGVTITHMPLVIDGSIKVFTEDTDGEELLLYYLEWGDTCAVTLNCCNSRTKSKIRAITETKSEILFIPVEKMDEWMVKYKSWRSYVLESYNERLLEMLTAIDTLVFTSLEERLKKYLKDKYYVTKNPTLQISHSDIARELHSSRVVISRVMKKLEKAGLLKQHRGSIELIGF